jgi:hypothetical protein
MNIHTTIASRRSDMAPWWLYAGVIVPTNFGKEQALPDDAAWWLRGALTATIIVVGIAVVTAVYRAGRDERIP